MFIVSVFKEILIFKFNFKLKEKKEKVHQDQHRKLAE